MGRKKNDNASTIALTDEEKSVLLAIQKAIGIALGGAAPAADDTPAEDSLGDTPAEDSLEGDSDDGLGGDSDDGLGGDEEPAITAENVRDELKKVIKKLGEEKGREKVAAILKKCGASKLPDLKEGKFEEAVKLAKKFQ